MPHPVLDQLSLSSPDSSGYKSFEFLEKSLIGSLHKPTPPTKTVYQNHQESRPAELPRQPLAELYVSLSTHTAPIIQPVTQGLFASEQTGLVYTGLAIILSRNRLKIIHVIYC